MQTRLLISAHDKESAAGWNGALRLQTFRACVVVARIRLRQMPIASASWNTKPEPPMGVFFGDGTLCATPGVPVSKLVKAKVGTPRRA